MTSGHVDTDHHPLDDPAYAERCRAVLDADGALVLRRFFTGAAVARVLDESAPREREAFYARSTHNVYLTDPDPKLPPEHPFNRQVASSKGLIADDQIPADSPLRDVYDDPSFRRFLCAVLGHRARSIRTPTTCRRSTCTSPPPARSSAGTSTTRRSPSRLLPRARGRRRVRVRGRRARRRRRRDGLRTGRAVLDGDEPVAQAGLRPGRPRPVPRPQRDAPRHTDEGPVTRVLAVFAFNDQPGVGLSESALTTFYGRTS